MQVQSITPILNVSNIIDSFAWFEQLGWQIGFKWGDPIGFGSVYSGECQLFLCQDGQGGRGKGTQTSTFDVSGADTLDKGVWMSMWVNDVDEIYQQCLERKIEVTYPPTDMPWNVREMHIRHPDGHVFRMSKGISE